MSRNIVDRPFVVGRNYIKAAGLSTDVKPTGTIITGSLFLETDTGKMYVYNETGESWTQVGGPNVTVEPLTVTENGVYTAPAGKAYNPVSVDVPQGGSVAANDVYFRDYDGTIVAAYSATDFATLTELPANPSHNGLTAQGWNWSLTDAQAYVAKYGKLEIGQMYITDDGKTRVYIHLEQGRTSPMLGCCPDGTVDVDWGDGTAHDTLTGTSTSTVQWTPNHAYAAPGDYVIELTVTGSMGFYGDSSQYSGLLRYAPSGDNRDYVYRNAVQRVEIGSGVTSIGGYAFSYCYSLASVTIPDGVTSIGGYAFSSCYSLASVTIPDGVTSIGDNAFYNCYNLANITIPDSVTSISSGAFNSCYNLASVTIPDGVTSIGGYAFQSCYSLASVTIPDGVTSIGSYAFNSCYSLANITIPDSVTSIGGYAFQNCRSLANITIPDGVTSIGDYAFENCCNLASVTILDGVTSIGGYAFHYCYSLANITIPDSVTSIGDYAFSYCYSLVNITIPDGVTSIGSNAFSYCYSLANITIPDSVTSIGGYAFQSCRSVAECHLAPTTPPTLSGTGVFSSIPVDCIIYVPYSADHSILEAYKTATRWSTYASKMQEEAA